MSLPVDVRADLILERAELRLLTERIHAGTPPAIAVHTTCGPDRPPEDPTP